MSDYELSDDPARVDVEAAHAYLTRSYWSPGISIETVNLAIANSHCVVMLHEGRQVGMARLISDQATFAYLADVYVLQEHRGRGLAKAMVARLQEDARFAGLRRWLLFTQDAHSLYASLGWTENPHPGRIMIRDKPDAYR